MFRETLEVSIVSLLATIDGGGPYGLCWHGLVPIEYATPRDGSPVEASNADAVNEALFRTFNRVTDEDTERLEALEYRLPSLSPGDLITWEKHAYRVLALGFERLEPTGAFTAHVRHRAPGDPSPALRELIGEYVEPHPNKSTALAVALTALARMCVETNTDPALIPVLAQLGASQQMLRDAFS
jgi:hypothetical protein